MPPTKIYGKSHLTAKNLPNTRDPDMQTSILNITSTDDDSMGSGSRRSSRPRVFNSRFKDMEVQLTPKRHHMKSDEKADVKNIKEKKTPDKLTKPTTVASDNKEAESCNKVHKRAVSRNNGKQKQKRCQNKPPSKRQKIDQAATTEPLETESVAKTRCTDLDVIAEYHSPQTDEALDHNKEHASNTEITEFLSISDKKVTNDLVDPIPQHTYIVESSEAEKPQVDISSVKQDNATISTTSSALKQKQKEEPICSLKADVNQEIPDTEVLKVKLVDITASDDVNQHLNWQLLPVQSTCQTGGVVYADGLGASAKCQESAEGIVCPRPEKPKSPFRGSHFEDMCVLVNGEKDDDMQSKEEMHTVEIVTSGTVRDGKEITTWVGQETNVTTNEVLTCHPKSVETTKDDAAANDKEQVKVMEEEMMNLLNLFLTDANQKSSQLEEKVDSSKTVATSEPANNVCQVAISDSTVDEQFVTSTCVQVQPLSTVNTNGVSNGTQIEEATLTRSRVHVLPVGSTVFLVDKDLDVGSNAEIGVEEKTSVETVPSCPVEDTTKSQTSRNDDAVNSMKQVHFLVKTPKNKVEINSDGVLSCTTCGTKVESSMKQSEHVCRPRVDNLLHIRGDGTFCCTKCDYKTEKKVNWYKHKLKHQERRYQCPKCDYKASTSSNLKRHVLSHDDVRVFGCKICWATFPQKVHLLRHIKSKHQPHSVQCSYCDYVCAEVQPDLVTHMKNKHPELCNFDKDGNPVKHGSGMLEAFLRYKCDKCNLYTFNRKDLQQHMKVHKKGPELKFFCEMCSFVTECESRLKRHMLTHTKEKPYGCTLCNYRGSLREHVKRHLKTKHKMDVSFGQQKKIRRYANNKSKSKDNSSLLLEGRFQNKKPYPLSDTRNSEKHFACNFCSMKFTKLISLFKHVHVQHSQMMPPDNSYSCVVCDYTTNQYKHLLLHMRKVHSTTNCMNTPQKQVYVCMSCRYSTPYRLFLHAHLKKEHNMQIVTDKYMMDASKHSSAMVQTSDESEEKKPGSIIKSTVIGKMAPQINTNTSKDSKMVLLQLTPDGPMTPVVINMGDRDTEVSNPSSSLLNGTDTEYSIMETGITDASCSLDMQCEVIFDDDLGQVLQDTRVTQETIASTPVETTAQVPVKDFRQVIQDMTGEAKNTLEDESVADITAEKQQESAETAELQHADGNGVQTEDASQVLHLSSGDFLEINGQIYKIEMEENVSKPPD